ncbi:MAG TPA: hypothetical protein VEB67_02160 [Nitrososphaerales archaeon]|nr:hypothetical protein [Nitrososphaerales archaeon]
MALEDYLMPSEEVRFHSSFGVHYGKKTYHAVLTDRRILLYAKRGAFFKNDDIVIQKISDLQGIKYQEDGLINRRGTIKILGARSEMDLWGSATEVKALYQQMMQFM